MVEGKTLSDYCKIRGNHLTRNLVTQTSNTIDMKVEGGMPGFPPGMQMPPGMPDLSALMNNPQIQQMLNAPGMQDMIKQMMGPDGMPRMPPGMKMPPGFPPMGPMPGMPGLPGMPGMPGLGPSPNASNSKP